MTSRSFHRQLDLPANPLRPGFVLPTDSTGNHYLVFSATEVPAPDIVHRSQQLGLQSGTATLFFKQPGSMGIIHTDVSLRGSRWRRNLAAINWNLAGADSLMRWYDVDLPDTAPAQVPSPDAGPWYRALSGIHFGFFGSSKPLRSDPPPWSAPICHTPSRTPTWKKGAGRSASDSNPTSPGGKPR